MNECIFMCVLNCIKFEDVDGEVVSVCIYIYVCVCRYTFGSRPSSTDRDKQREEKERGGVEAHIRRLKETVPGRGMRTTVEAVMLVHQVRPFTNTCAAPSPSFLPSFLPPFNGHAQHRVLARVLFTP